MSIQQTFYEAMREHGITRRSFLKFCSLTAAGLGMGPEFAGKIAHALETKPRTPVIWLHGLECTCCTESFIRSGHPLAADVILSMISLDYDDTLMAAAGHQAEEILEQTVAKYDGKFILACEGNPPLNEDGMYCIQAGKPYVEKLRHMANHCKAIIAWGSCASWGCVQAAKPNPTRAVPIHKVITDKPIIKVPGCPPIAEVMTGVITYMLTFDRFPELDRQGRPKMFYSQRLHDKCYRRPHFDAGQFVERFDDEGARKGYCLYKVGCKGPTTYNACSTLGRTAARGLECTWPAHKMRYVFDNMMANLKAGDTATANMDKWEPETWPVDTRGVGQVEAPRGALGHWIHIKDTKIENYQAVVPTTWNASPRDPQVAELELRGFNQPVPRRKLLRGWLSTGQG